MKELVLREPGSAPTQGAGSSDHRALSHLGHLKHRLSQDAAGWILCYSGESSLRSLLLEMATERLNVPVWPERSKKPERGSKRQVVLTCGQPQLISKFSCIRKQEMQAVAQYKDS